MIQANIPAQPTADLGTSTWSREESTLVTTGDSVAKMWSDGNYNFQQKMVILHFYHAGFWNAKLNAIVVNSNHGFFNSFAVELILHTKIFDFEIFKTNSIFAE